MKIQTRKLSSDLRTFLILGIAILLLLLQLISSLPNVSTPITKLDLGSRDTLMRIRGVRPLPGDVVIVAIDDQSFKETGYQWPWPRTYLAQIVDAINRGRPRVVGLDVFLFEADKDPNGDPALVKALGESPAAVLDMQIVRDSPQQVTLNQPLPAYRQVLDGLGITTIVQDNDAINRNLQAYDLYGDQVFYNWAFQAARLYLNVPAPSNPSTTGLTFNGRQVPLHNGLLTVNFSGPAGTYPTYPAFQVVNGDVYQENPDAFKDKIVLIGATTITLHDVYPTPFSTEAPMPGVEVVANAIDTILSGNYLRETPPWAALLIILAMAILAWLLTRSPRPTMNLIAMGLAMIVYAVVVYMVFNRFRLYLPMVGPQLMLFLGVVLPTLEQSVSQELEKRRVRSMFTRFISPQMVDRLLTTQDITSLNKRADITILFSDIRGFTTLSEKLSPEEVVSLLNPYLEAMTRIIDDFGGTVDKYEGDAIIAFFGEPLHYEDHALRAVRTAVEMRRVLAGLRQQWVKEGRPHQIEIGIGLNTGEVFVGLLGSAQRINYTVIGDNVNLASRLQDLTKAYQWPILISESTYQQVKGEYEAELIDSVVVRGKTEPVKIYKLLGRNGAPEAERIQPWDEQTISSLLSKKSR